MEAQLEEKNQELQRVCVPGKQLRGVEPEDGAQAGGAGASFPTGPLPDCQV